MRVEPRLASSEKGVYGLHYVLSPRHWEHAMNRNPAFTLEPKKPSNREWLGAHGDGNTGLYVTPAIAGACSAGGFHAHVCSSLVKPFDGEVERPFYIVVGAATRCGDPRCILETTHQ